jgi:glycine hydroxymethyltransferase
MVLDVCQRFRPRLLIVGGSSYPRAVDFEMFRAAADTAGAYLLADIAHISGLVAAGLHPDPIPYAHVVTTSTNKNLRGPRGGMVLSDDAGVSSLLDAALFPGVQGGLLPEYVAAKAVCFGEALRPEFAEYAGAVLDNAGTLAATLAERGHTLVIVRGAGVVLANFDGAWIKLLRSPPESVTR